MANGDSSDRSAARKRPRREYQKGRYTPRRKVCAFCVDNLDFIDYKEVPRLRRFVSDRGKIEPRRKTGTCARHQRSLTIALKRARHLALLPFTGEHVRSMGGPISAPMGGPMREPMREPVRGSVREPVREPVKEPVTEPATEPAGS